MSFSLYDNGADDNSVSGALAEYGLAWLKSNDYLELHSF